MQEIEKIKIVDIRHKQSPGLIINRFYTLLTIAIVSVAIIWYVNYVLPQQKLQKLKEQQKLEYIKKLQEKKRAREAQIELSKKLNNVSS